MTGATGDLARHGALPQKIVVTGGAGFIGANLCAALVAAGAGEVIALDDLSSGRADNLAEMGTVELAEGSILDERLLDDVLAGAGAVVHLAARPSVARSLEDPAATHEANATGTLRVLEAARRAGRPQVVVASSSSVYGGSQALPAREDGPTSALSPYAASKLAAEGYALAYGRSFGLPVLAFRFFNVYGPLQRADHAYAAVIPAFVSAALRGDVLSVHGDGRQTRDFTYVGSVVSVLIEALARSVVSPTPVNLAFGGRCSIVELAELLGTVLGIPLATRHDPVRPGDVRDSQADQTRLRSLFPSLEPVGLQDGLARTVAWFRTVGADSLPQMTRT